LESGHGGGGRCDCRAQPYRALAWP
jgi:hypothetical protein